MGKSSLHHVTQWESPAVKQKVRDTIPITDLFQRKKLKTKYDMHGPSTQTYDFFKSSKFGCNIKRTECLLSTFKLHFERHRIGLKRRKLVNCSQNGKKIILI